jgi:uncharacterized membrane protein HdeD (DUF308 family)
VAALAVMVGIALVVSGLAGIARPLARRSAEPAAELIGGAAGIVFGVLALAWPDVTIFVMAVLFGARRVLFGFSQLIAVIAAPGCRTSSLAAGSGHGRYSPTAPAAEPGPDAPAPRPR